MRFCLPISIDNLSMLLLLASMKLPVLACLEISLATVDDFCIAQHKKIRIGTAFSDLNEQRGQ
jgi:hypothetical protein